MKQGVDIRDFVIEEELYHKDTLLLRYTVHYPQFFSAVFPVACINQQYASEATAYAQYCRQTLFRLAKEQYVYSLKIGAPVRMFEAVMDYKITMNQQCTLSLFFDRYEFTGGAHGNTVRSSDTWNLPSCARISLYSLCAMPAKCRSDYIRSVTQQIGKQIAAGAMYFEDYEKNVEQYFNPESFYLNPQGVIVYFQQYEIAPYASGIPEFLIPYSDMVQRPGCI